MAGMELLSMTQLLKRREKARGTELLWMLILGIPLSLILPIILGSMAYFAYHQYAGGHGSWLGWMAIVAFFAAIFIPLLLLREKSNIAPDAAIIRTREDDDGRRVVATLQSEIDLQSFGPMGMQLGDGQSDGEHWAIRPFFIGPRLIVRAMPQRKLLQLLTANADLPRAAEVLLALAARDRGMDIVELQKPDEPPEKLTPTLAYLRQLDWVDCRSDGSHIWLSSARSEQVRQIRSQFASAKTM